MQGCIMAFEGIDGAQVIVNGPTGCKYPPAANSEEFFLRSGTYDPYRYMSRYYFSQPRVPCTYMDPDDLILGTDDKLRELGGIILKDGPDLLGIINSPGAALIGSKLDIIKDDGIPVIGMENPGYSESFDEGFQDTFLAVLDRICGRREVRKGTVNIIGLSIRELSWRDDITELRRMLSMCGIEVISFIGAGCTVQELKDSVNAEYNILLHRNLGDRICGWYSDRYSMPFIDAGLPIGFDACESWICGICGKMDKDPQKVLAEIKLERGRAANEIRHINMYSDIPGGYTFSVTASGPLTYHITKLLYGYLGMIPVALDPRDDSYESEIRGFVDDMDLEISDDVFGTPADIFLGNAPLASDLMFRDIAGRTVNIESPRMARASIRKRPLLGIEGTKEILDDVMNAVDSI